MNRTDLIIQLRRSACDAGAQGFIHWQEYMADAADMLEGLSLLTIGGAPVTKGKGEGPTLSAIFASLGLEPGPELDRHIKGYSSVQSAAAMVESVVKATHVYRFEAMEGVQEPRFFDTFAEAKAWADTLKYSLVGYDPEIEKWSVDELNANYG